jgi:hypothetical protein
VHDIDFVELRQTDTLVSTPPRTLDDVLAAARTLERWFPTEPLAAGLEIFAVAAARQVPLPWIAPAQGDFGLLREPDVRYVTQPPLSFRTYRRHNQISMSYLAQATIERCPPPAGSPITSP